VSRQQAKSKKVRNNPRCFQREKREGKKHPVVFQAREKGGAFGFQEGTKPQGLSDTSISLNGAIVEEKSSQ
jgi:hypothetical protein